ncbi:MAG: hypothetical protein ACOX1Q_00050 [Eubacteriales bacterium]
MGRFNFDDLNRLTALEQLCKEWCLLSLKNLGENAAGLNILADPTSTTASLMRWELAPHIWLKQAP